MAKEITVALAGNPNCGKTTVFNNLTGGCQHVGNWPGVTVEKKEGICTYQGYLIRIVDLPGVYSLTAYSPDEVVARNFIVEGKPDVVVDIVDASNLQRNLYLTVQILEMKEPLVLVLNMMDVAESRNYHIDSTALSREIGAPVIPMVANRNEGTESLLQHIVTMFEQKTEKKEIKVHYGHELEEHIEKLETLIAADEELLSQYPPRWLAVKLLEEDEEVLGKITSRDKILRAKESAVSHLKSVFGDDAESVIADARYGFIDGLLKDAFTKPPVENLTISDKIDGVVVNRWFGIPLFFAILYGIFQFVFTLSAPFMDWIDQFFSWLGAHVSGISPAWLQSLFVDGILNGLGSVLVFIPPIFLLYIAIAILEDCGYMARVAFVMDRLMHKIGLHGRSFIPMILGFGCNIPGIMACRTIENPKDRLITILINPFMSCSARLPIYVLLAGAFFPANAALVVFSMYLIGILVAIIMAVVLRKTLLKGPSGHFVMELPPYRFPTAKGVLVHMWERGSLFLRKAGTIIFGAVVVVWLLSSLPWGVEYASSESVIGRIGSFVAPLFTPAGFGQWQAAVSLLFGFLAKEVVVGTLGTVFAVEEGALGGALVAQLGWTSLTAFAFMVFCLLYAPCVASMATIRNETASWKWTGFALLYTTAVAWIAATLIFQIGSLFT